jgi:hypothetical protein
MQLETYISNLLYRYDCVTISDFGAFLTHRVSAKLNNSTHTFYPPKKVLSFNEQLQHNDGLLPNYIAEVEKIPYEVAVQKIAKYVKSIKSYLIQGETITFNSIGTLILNDEGRINFEPVDHINYLTDSFGLDTFNSQNITRVTYKEAVEKIEKVIPITITPEKRKARPYLKYAAIALIALTSGGFIASNYYVNQIEAQNQIAQEEANHQLDAKVQEATFVISNPLPAATLMIEKQSGNYHIVAGAFRVEVNSDNIVKQLQDLGYNARKIGVNKYGLHEVVYSSYDDRIEALKALRTIQKEHNKDAWLKVDSETSSKNVSTKKYYNNQQPEVQITNQPKNISEIESKNSVNSLPKTTANFDLEESPNIIKIIKNVKTVDSGYYIILATYADILKRDGFLTELKSKGMSDIGFFFDIESDKYFIYHQKFGDLETALKALQAKRNLSYKGKMAVVKVEN